MITFRALSALLSYPDAALAAAVPEIRAALLHEGLLGPQRIQRLEPLLASLGRDDLFDLQERYVLLFDRSRSLSLDLFEHVHGESRARGGAMVDLLQTYRAGGFDLAGTALPDHLPVLLEFLSTRPLDEAVGMLADAGPILVALAERHVKRESAYAGVFEALVGIAGSGRHIERAADLPSLPDDDPEDLAALDRVYEEAQVTFAPAAGGCPAARDVLARMSAPLAAPAARAMSNG